MELACGAGGNFSNKYKEQWQCMGNICSVNPKLGMAGAGKPNVMVAGGAYHPLNDQPLIMQAQQPNKFSFQFVKKYYLL